MLRKVSASLLSLIMLVSVVFTAAAFAAESTASYKFSVPEKLGIEKEKLSYIFGDVIEEDSFDVILVPEGASLLIQTTNEIAADFSILSVNEDGQLEALPSPWTVNGSYEISTGLPANSEAVAKMNKSSYYLLSTFEEGAEEGGRYIFKAVPAKGAEPAVTDSPSDWAKAEVEQAIAEGLVPEVLQGKYTDNITRGEFSKLVIAVVEAITGQDVEGFLHDKGIPQAGPKPFTDTDLAEVTAAFKLGIVSGKGEGIFDPAGSITRQEAAVMLANTVKALELDTTVAASAFTDGADVADWAKTAVDFVFYKGIMTGVEGNRFEPNGTYTRQQAYLTALRLYNAE
jgi:hypothetical protein